MSGLDHSPTRLPDFFLVGAPRAGTTSLADYLGQHPEVFMSPVKEPGYFARELIRMPGVKQQIRDDRESLRSYLDGPMSQRHHERFVCDWDCYVRLFKNAGDAAAAGEASPSYLASKRAPGAIARRIPDARIVMILRDPIDRMFSNYAGAVAAGATDLPFQRWAVREIDHDERTSATFGVYASSL